MSKAEKLTDQEFNELQAIKEDAVQVASILGELSYQKLSIELQIEQQKQKISEIKSREAIYFKSIEKKYGGVVVNLETGELSSQ